MGVTKRETQGVTGVYNKVKYRRSFWNIEWYEMGLDGGLGLIVKDVIY